MKAKKMDIQLKQDEIKQAVRNYVAEKVGINLLGKNLGIEFSMTRGASGLIANLSISDSSDVQIPGYTDRDADTQLTSAAHPAPATVVHNVAAITAALTAAASTPAPSADDAALTEKSVPVEEFDASPAVTEAPPTIEAEAAPAETTSTTSLFS